MKYTPLTVSPLSFPGQLASDSEKESPEFGLRIGQAIQFEWFRRDGNTCQFYNQWLEFHRRRLYARGEQSIAKYKTEFAVDGDLSYLNLDWTPVPIIPKFVDIVVNGMNDRLFKVQAEAVDAMASERKSAYQSMVEGDMIAKDFLLQTQEEFGVNAFNVDQEKLPETDQELALYMQMNYKPGIEIAEETAISTLLQDNHYDDIRRRVDYDLMVVGMGVVKHTFLPNDGVKVDYVDPANIVYSYTESPYFKDCFYFGEVKRVPVTELLKINPDLTDEELKDIVQLGSAWYDYYGILQPYRDSLFQKDVVTLLYYNYKTSKHMVYKKKFLDNGGERTLRKDENFNPETDDEDRFIKQERRIDVWYDGIMVLGSNYLLKWELAKNMVRPQSASQRALPNYVAVAPRMYKGVIESLVRRMIPFADLIQMTHLKLQQVLQRVVPDGVFIDADGLNEVDLGTGAAYNPEDALRLYFQTGSVIGRSFTQDGEYNHAKIPIQELNTNSGQAKISSLISSYNHYLSMIRDVTGLNEARDASTPDPNSLVGLQKLAALNSNTATRHILEGSLFITRQLAEGLSIRIADVLQYAPFREEFANQIGKYNIQLLESINELYLHDFGIFIQVAPDEEEKAQLEANIQMALQQDSINLEDAIDIRMLSNLKLANELLKVKRKEKNKQDQQAEQQKMEMQSKINMQSQQAASQAKMQLLEMETQAKIQVEQAEAAFQIEKLTAEKGLKQELMQTEFEMQMQIKKMEADALKNREDEREVSKDNRVSQQNSQQSQLISQRTENAPPISFESNEDTLDGFDLAQFEPG
tara:strand:+ start:3862 stop:6291 length:2430 start_codon:yes stop_codon:yes gene_type:complete